MYHSAIPSWYGYRYQGQLAIYYSIKQIYNIIQKIEKTDDNEKEHILKNQLEKYALEIEGMEDFAIRYYKDNLNYSYISFHQVKAGDSMNIIDKEVIYGVLEHLIDYQTYIDENDTKNSTYGYIHVPNQEISLETEDFKKLYIEKQDNYLQELNEIIKDQRGWEGLKEKIKGRAKKHTAKNIIINRLKDLNIEKIKENHEDIIEIVNTIKTEIEEKNYPESSVQIGIYTDIYFSSIDDIETEIISVVKNIHREFEKFNNFMSSNSIKRKIFPQLIQKITELIDKIKKNPESDSIIKFIDIYNLIVEVQEQVDSNYEAYKFRLNIVGKFPNYIARKCGQNSYDCNDCNKRNECNVADFMNKLERLEISDVNKFISNTAIARDPFSCEQEIPAFNEVKNTIFKYLSEVSKFKLQKCRVSAYQNEKNYWCTCEEEISIEDIEDYKVNIVNVLYEADFLITKGNLEEFEVFHILESFSMEEIEKMENLEIREKCIEDGKRFSKTKKIKTINIEAAKEVLNDD